MFYINNIKIFLNIFNIRKEYKDEKLKINKNKLKKL